MAAATEQLFSTTGLLAGLFYGLGIIALLWVVRRTVFRERRRARQPRPDSRRRRRIKARASIEEIDGRHWRTRYRGALILRRGLPLSESARNQLRELSAYQRARRCG